MKLVKPLLPIFVAAATMTSPTGYAKDFSTEASVTLVSQYLFRGFDLNQEDPALQGDFIVNHESGFWFGAWGSIYDVGVDDGVEIDLMAGYSYAINDSVSFNVGLTEYTYTGDADATTEFSVGVSVDQFSLTYYDDVDIEASYISLDAEFELAPKFSLALHAARYDVDDAGDNNDFSVGLNYAATNALTVFGLFSSNDLDVEGAEDYFVVGATYGF